MNKHEISGKKHSIDMTEGPIWRLLVMFAIPLLLGNLFQQLYNTVDSIILGNFVSKAALAAVGSTTSMCNTLINFFNGVSIGAGVVISHYFGAKDSENLHSAIETSITVAFVIGFAASLLAIPFVPLMLDLISTPADMLEEATVYLRIYFMGVIFLFTYNMGSGILRAVGDTQRPLRFLIISSLLNIGLDLLFVVGFQMGIAGAAFATIISEAVSAVLVCMHLGRIEDVYRLTLRDLHINWAVLKRILIVGLPVGIQQSLTAFSNTFVQAYVNRFDSTDIVAGWSAHVKVDQFGILPAQSIGQATTTFVSQNLGAGKLERAKKGTKTALVMGVGVLLVISAIIFVSAEGLASLFNQEPEVVYYGTLFIALMVPFRFFSALNQVYAGSMRGTGDSRGPMFIMLFSLVLVRQAYLYIATHFVNNVYVVGLGYPVGWMASALLGGWYYYHSGWERRYQSETLDQNA